MFFTGEGILVEWSFLINGGRWIVKWAVKCELINYSYRYVQLKCVTLLDTENLKQFFKIYHLHVGLSKFNHQDATPMLVNMIIIFTAAPGWIQTMNFVVNGQCFNLQPRGTHFY